MGKWKKLFKDNFDENFFCDQSNQKIWEAVYGIPDEEIWNTRLKQLSLIHISVEKTWRLNEKHYGMLQGLNKSETAVQYGEEQVDVYKRQSLSSFTFLLLSNR